MASARFPSARSLTSACWNRSWPLWLNTTPALNAQSTSAMANVDARFIVILPPGDVQAQRREYPLVGAAVSRNRGKSAICFRGNCLSVVMNVQPGQCTVDHRPHSTSSVSYTHLTLPTNREV